ncbi:MAG: molybdenum cofactor biosynthesis protein MoaE [Roseovarius sp.]|nr:molybdenum cofactor biosynthesis protein MoaE [Roseovarius sp.]MCY4206464.1 molybdenum cofactor biosynthesis protein MoaE [Roseovarius sp.]MCY4291315.1 molybdenum cofactor biosynthesis protein MoaE [Roseovarius sp.]MCY4316424.1 molybdenum cofactor biosynthesis protein MoaE [Roseovarius sp.]
MEVRIQREPFDLGAEANAFSERQSGIGAVVIFSGIVRDLPGGELEAMEIEHYPGMTERSVAKIAEEALNRWSLGDVLIIHRYGALKPDEMIMMVATSASHRAEAFQSADFLMDFLKSRAPFWKKEIGGPRTGWVEAKREDEDALDRW